jgi:hypothetical protein
MPNYRFQKRPPSGIFDYLGCYQTILVTGPHRAGTTIAAAMIANDLQYEFFEDHSLENFCKEHHIYPCSVIHCPSYCHYIHQLADIPHLAAVIVARDVNAIIASEKRIPWAFEPQQLNFYRFEARPRPAFAVQPPIAEVKYRYWQEVQKPIFGKNGYEIRYEDLSRHPMWLSSTDRNNFTANQLEIGVPHGPRVQGRRLPVGIEGKIIREEK